MKVLVAEDDKVSRDMLSLLLESWDYEAVCVADGRAALDLLMRTDSPQLVLLDWLMPEMDGIDVCRIYREREQQGWKYLLILTVRTSQEDIVRAFQAGADDYVTKPFFTEELRGRLDAGRRIVELQAINAARVAELEAALAHVKRLQGIIPVCCGCNRIRTDQDSWMRIEKYIEEHTDFRISHGMCPDCIAQQYPGYVKRKAEKEGRALPPDPAKPV